MSASQSRVRRLHQAAQAVPIEILESCPPRVRRWQIHDFATGSYLGEPATTEGAAWTAAAATLPADGSPAPLTAEEMLACAVKGHAEFLRELAPLLGFDLEASDGAAPDPADFIDAARAMAEENRELNEDRDAVHVELAAYSPAVAGSNAERIRGVFGAARGLLGTTRPLPDTLADLAALTRRQRSQHHRWADAGAIVNLGDARIVAEDQGSSDFLWKLALYADPPEPQPGAERDADLDRLCGAYRRLLRDPAATMTLDIEMGVLKIGAVTLRGTSPKAAPLLDVLHQIAVIFQAASALRQRADALETP